MNRFFKQTEVPEPVEPAPVIPAVKVHRVLWDAMYDQLTADEARAVYGAMEKAVFRPGQVIYRQGVINGNLYFFESGQGKHTFMQNDREMFIRKVRVGEIAGEDNFFDAGCSTTTLVAVDQTEVRFLPGECLSDFEARFPGLEQKLRIFCSGYVKIGALLTKNAQDRRVCQRIPLSGLVLIKLGDESGELLGRTLRGNLGDISRGGISAFISLDSRQQAQVLLGSWVDLRFHLPPDMQLVKQSACVLGVRQLSFDNEASGRQDRYSVHLQFAELLAEKTIGEMARHLKIVDEALFC